jgi:phosphoribosylformylglycinamidine synthase
VVAGTAAYCVANLFIPGYDLPWEEKGFAYPSNLASGLDIEIEASGLLIPPTWPAAWT